MWTGRKAAPTPLRAGSRTPAKWIEQKYSPTLNLIYLPHLDYNLQRHGPAASGHRDRISRRIDAIAGDLITFFQARGVRVVLLSEYGIDAVDTPVHLNRLFRQEGWIAIKEELGLELLDCGASKVFAVADHQVAHIYLNDRSLESRAGLARSPAGRRIRSWRRRRRPSSASTIRARAI